MYTSDELEGRFCLVCCNLKPAKLAGFKSHGMILCAVGDNGSGSGGKVEVVEAPADAAVGERIVLALGDDFEGSCELDITPVSPNQGMSCVL
jgi:tRNA-binding EMAP/Myf-like protein